MITSTEPVLVAGGTTAVASALVAIGQVTGLYRLSADEAVTILSGVVVVVSAVTHWWARRRTVPMPPAIAAQPPH